MVSGPKYSQCVVGLLTEFKAISDSINGIKIGTNTTHTEIPELEQVVVLFTEPTLVNPK